jgi:GNAT superfamily N-acetyltransferase
MEMLVKLPPEEYDQVRPLFAPISYNLAIDSILSGFSPGSIYVDNRNNPRLAVTRTNSRLFLAGQPRESFVPALNHYFLGRFYPEARAIGLGGYSLHYTPGWEIYVEKSLTGVHPMRGSRHYYSLAISMAAPDMSTPAGYEIHPVDAALLACTNLRNLAGVEEEMQSERPTIGDFLAKSFGFCAIKEGAIVAWCMSEYNLAGRCEIGIWTDEDHRRQGLAVATATAVIDHALSKGISQIGWHCWARNAPSIAAARSLGFSLAATYPVNFAYIDEQLNLAVNGTMCLEAGNVRQALDWFEEARSLGELPAWAIGKMARAQELSGA